jgi:ornithine lipid ester-linked acyl 2-hydroxylase
MDKRRIMPNIATLAEGAAGVVKLKFDRDLVIAAGLRFLPFLDAFLMRYNAVEEREIFPAGVFAWTGELEANWSAVRAEAERVLADRNAIPPLRALSPDHHLIAVDDSWRSFFLWGYGTRYSANCQRCPETSRLLERVPGLLSAFFSVMLSGAHVPRHTGPTKAILTAHLGLMVPGDREGCQMAIGEEGVVRWEEGRVVVFDDMYPHEVWNETCEDRIILLLHVKRPLRFPGWLMRDVFFAALRRSPFVQDGLRNLERWEKRETASRRDAA